ncbi:hypothetical protein [Phenylobacterium sp.]|uniref:hypothetical protein n=1 Tax=Phenylobacterium sp. TaxID=1871053 RepID=UPI003568A2A3
MDTNKLSGRELRDLAVLLGVGLLLAIAGVAIIQLGGYPAVGGVCLLVGLAAFGAGSALGFIFGLPRVFSDDAQTAKAISAAAAAPAGAEPRTGKRYLKSNANLERISDWLTTMLVGVALTQLLNIGKALAQFQDFLRGFSHACGDQTPCNADALATAGPIVLVMGAVAGFLFMYLYTRLVLTQVFNKVEGDLENVLTATGSDSVRANFSGKGVTGETSAPPLSVEAALQLMFAALYEPPPRGYEKALNTGAVLSNTVATRRADYWFYLAAAFGQKLNELRKRRRRKDIEGLGQDEQSALDNAIDAAQRAVAIDPAYKARLRNIANPDGPDDDLTLVARDHARWEAIIK